MQGVGNNKRNYILLLMEGILFTVGTVFFDANTILPLLLKRLTGSSILVGLLGMAPALGMGITSLIAGNWVRPYQFKKKFVVSLSSVGRLPLWILGLSLIFVPGLPPALWALLIIGIQFLFWFVDGAVYTAWADILGKSISNNGRGRFLAIMQIIAGVLSIFAGMMIKKILALDTLNFPINYGVISTIGALLFTLSIIGFAGIKESPSSTSTRVKVRELFANVPQYFRDSRSFALSMTVLLLCSMTSISRPFYIIFGEVYFGFGDSMVGVLISSQIIGRMLGGMLLGFLGDKFGHEKAILGYSISGLIPPLLATIVALIGVESLTINLLIFNVIYFFLGMFLGGWASFMNYMLDLVPNSQQSLYAGLINMVRIPAALAPFIGGIIVSLWGYLPIFIIAIIFTIIGINIAIKLPPAERTNKTNASTSL